MKKPKQPLIAEFEGLYQHHSKEVWALVYARWLNADVAQDIMQETFLRLWKQRLAGGVILNPRAWLLRVARNLAEDYAKSAFRRNGTQPPQTMNGVQGKESLPLRVARNLAEDYANSAFRRNGTQPPELLNGVRSSQPAPAELLEREETFAQIRAVLGELSPADRDILSLRYALDYNAAQIADVLDINPTAVHMRLSRARQRLAERLTAQGVHASHD